jgi:hypothetical protein
MMPPLLFLSFKDIQQQDRRYKEKLKHIKQSFRLMMNGPTSQSMREKGSTTNQLGRALRAAQADGPEQEKDYDLAIALWKEDIRECKIPCHPPHARRCHAGRGG